MQKDFSNDLEFRAFLNPAVRNMSAYHISGGQNAEIKLNQNENPLDLPDWLKEKILADFAKEQWNRYPEIFPNQATRKYAEFLDVPAECVLMGNGSNELLYTIFMATLTKGASVLIPQPSFSLYEKIADILNADVIAVPMTSSFEFQPERIIAEAKNSQPNLIVLSTPNNPTSKSLSYEQIKQIVTETDSIVLADEAYIEFSKQKSALDLIYEHSNLLVLRTMSKAFSLAGVRVGFAISHPELLKEISKPKIPFASNRLAELCLIHVLENYSVIDERVKMLLGERERMAGILAKMNGIFLHESDTNFFIIEVEQPGEVFNRLKAKDIIVRNVSSYPMMEKCLRINVGTKAENDRFLSELEKIMNEG
ncbi:histidinol-phosphate aminotransferase [Chloroherpeton thalassium ATCC 35110]|uniref:Histidinol-phosphate aminotransferase n=1 Tax=Chloroherpeton thalassium (strain ATCC 35110 / GB-78) TaxID=517418 RepID=B3QSY6_CHLT3|nr:histidinol-phosphate transaminase [Chloroherpeton thalassium]ACF12629.1 histidinol-phosphate aminotransferase [Chloroherpeton thalassium ATCC 35110]